MECLNPLIISTHSKVISPLFGERLKYEVRCGRCANCQTTFQREWYFRAFHEFQSTVRNNGYMLMDCLTYDNKHVPKLWRFFPDLPEDMNYMCFDYFDLRYFLVRLRDYLTKQGYEVKNTLRYFAAAEYGTDSDCTHRPHIHLLFYVTTPNLDNMTLSKAISKCWHYGRTDGLPYKSHSYVNNYTIKDGLASSQRVCKYVSKYVMKNSEYQNVIDESINNLLYYYYENKFKYFVHGDWKFTVDYEYRQPVERVSWETFESFLRSSTAKKLKTDLKRYLNQFHRQSKNFGFSAVETFDIDKVVETNLVTIQDSKSVVMRLGLPNYFRRKLFYHVVDVNGLKSWVLNDDLIARKYKEKRDADKMKHLIEKFDLVNFEYGLSIDSKKLAEYVLNKRWRDNSSLFNEDLNILEKLQVPNLFSYSTRADFSYFHGNFITDTFLGSSNSGFIYNRKPTKSINVVSFCDYIKQHCFELRDFEKILSFIKEKKWLLNTKIQTNFDNLQRLNQVYKNLLQVPSRARSFACV